MGKRVRTTRQRPWHYTDCGLDNIFLIGIEVETDPETGEKEPIIPQLKDLHDCIFAILLQKPGPLSGKETRYLRRHLCWTQTLAAEKLGFNSAQYFSDLERKGRSPAFSDIRADFVWRLLCVKGFYEKTTGLRKKQAKRIALALEEVDRILAEIRTPKAPCPVEIKRKARIWEPSSSVAAA